MRKTWIALLLTAVTLTAAAQEATQKDITIEVKNQWEKLKTDEPIIINIKDLRLNFEVKSAVVMNGKTEIPSQLDDLDGDLRADELSFVVDLPAKSKQQFTITLSATKPDKQYPARVFAQMLSREAKKNNHVQVQSITVPGTVNYYNMVEGHGPMFESELVGYRIYFNQKQTIDPYGKFNRGLELEECQFYPKKEHLDKGFGDDVLMVGNSCGVGALKGWDGTKATHIEPVAFRTERIVATGPIRTVVEVEVKGWEYQGSTLCMTHRYILYAGHRDLRIETRFSEPLKHETFCTGVQNIMGTTTVHESDHQGLTGSWGHHWPVTDTIHYAKETVGLATYIPRQYVVEEVSDADNFLYTIAAPGDTEFHYYTMFTSKKETFGFADSQAWFAYMREWKQQLEHPVSIELIRKTTE